MSFLRKQESTKANSGKFLRSPLSRGRQLQTIVALGLLFVALMNSHTIINKFSVFVIKLTRKKDILVE